MAIKFNNKYYWSSPDKYMSVSRIHLLLQELENHGYKMIEHTTYEKFAFLKQNTLFTKMREQDVFNLLDQPETVPQFYVYNKLDIDFVLSSGVAEYIRRYNKIKIKVKDLDDDTAVQCLHIPCWRKIDDEVAYVIGLAEDLYHERVWICATYNDVDDVTPARIFGVPLSKHENISPNNVALQLDKMDAHKLICMHDRAPLTDAVLTNNEFTNILFLEV